MLYGLQNFHIQDSFGYYNPFSEMQSEVYKKYLPKCPELMVIQPLGNPGPPDFMSMA